MVSRIVAFAGVALERRLSYVFNIAGVFLYVDALARHTNHGWLFGRLFILRHRLGKIENDGGFFKLFLCLVIRVYLRQDIAILGRHVFKFKIINQSKMTQPVICEYTVQNEYPQNVPVATDPCPNMFILPKKYNSIQDVKLSDVINAFPLQ